MKEISIENFQKIKELKRINDLDNFLEDKNINYFLSGRSMVNQKMDKKKGDVVTVYKTIKTGKNKMLYIPEYFKLV